MKRRSIFELLVEYHNVFATSVDELGRTKVLKHMVHTKESVPIRQPVRRLPPCRKEKVHLMLQDMVKQEVIQPSSSPRLHQWCWFKEGWDTPFLCVDYRKINAITRRDAYPLPRVDDTLDTLSGSCLFSTLDLASGYWQVELDEASHEKTAFCTPSGLYEIKVMPFGLCNAPATFQQLMDLVLTGLQWSHLDLASGYWQVELDEASREKTGFCTPSGLYEFSHAVRTVQCSGNFSAANEFSPHWLVMVALFSKS